MEVALAVIHAEITPPLFLLLLLSHQSLVGQDGSSRDSSGSRFNGGLIIRRTTLQLSRAQSLLVKTSNECSISKMDPNFNWQLPFGFPFTPWQAFPGMMPLPPMLPFENSAIAPMSTTSFEEGEIQELHDGEDAGTVNDESQPTLDQINNEPTMTKLVPTHQSSVSMRSLGIYTQRHSTTALCNGKLPLSLPVDSSTDPRG